MGLWKKYNGKGFFAEIAEKDKFGNDISESLSNKVDKVEGYGLSQENFTSAYKDKLDTITSGAEPNVQSDWEEVDSASDGYIKNKPDPISIQAGDNISITESGSSLIISSQSAPQVNADWNSTSGVSEILNKPDLSVYAEIDDLASVAFTGDYEDLTNTPNEKTFSAGPNITITSADDTITIGATVPEQVQSDWEETDTSALSYIKNKPAPLSLIPGNGISVSETHDGLEIAVSASYAETSAVNAALDDIEDEIDYVSGAVDKINTDLEDYVTETEMEAAIADFGGFKKVQVDQSGEPDVDDPNTKIIYLTHIDSATGPDLYREWLWDSAGPSWEMLGDTSISLQGYATETYVQQETSGKVDKVEGKGLSTNDFTDELLDKLNDIESSAQKNVQSDWEETDTTSDSYIQNKPTPISMKGGVGISVTESQGDLVISVSADYATEDYVDQGLDDKLDKTMSAEFYPYHSNPSGYLVNSDLGGYATQTWVGEQGYLTEVPEGYATESYVDSHTSGKMDKSQSADFYPMATNPSGYLTQSDLSSYATEEYVQQETSGKVDAVEGYGLSENDFTDAYKTKLDDIEYSAQQNVQSDWEETDASSDAYIWNKPSSISLSAGEYISITESSGNLEISCSGVASDDDLAAVSAVIPSSASSSNLLVTHQEFDDALGDVETLLANL